MKKIKIKNKKKAKSRIFLLFIILIILFFIIGNYKSKNNNNLSQIILLINNEDYSTKLINPIYITTQNTVYMSIEDIKNIYDENILLDTDNNQIITTYKTKIAVINIENNTVRINGTQIEDSLKVICNSEKYYIPISNLTSVFNIEINLFQNNKIVAIDSLDEELLKGTITKKTSLKQEQKLFSKTIYKIKKNETVVIIEKYDNGWSKIRTEEGIIGYIKQKKIKDEKIVRQKLDISQSIDVNEVKTKVIDASTIKDSEIQDYDLREKYIEKIILNMIEDEYKTLCIDFNEKKAYNEYLNRLIIEFKPRLLEYGKKLEVINKE